MNCPVTLRLLALAVLTVAQWASAEPISGVYHTNRVFMPIDTTIQGTPTAFKVQQASGRFTEVVGPGSVLILTNLTYATESEGFAWGYPTATDAWNAAIAHCGVLTQHEDGVYYDNAGWVRGTKEVLPPPAGGASTWGAYLWLLQNQITFMTSTSRFWVSADGQTNVINKVLVGSLGDYVPISQVTDIGPTNYMGASFTNYLGASVSEDARLAPNMTAYYDVSVLSVGMEIYKPKVVDPAEPMISDADELTKGSVTFVNLDNDDNDSKFDHGGASTDDEVTGGDDELVKVKLKLKPSSLTEGEVKLLATAGAGNIAVWTINNKAAASAYTLGTALNVLGDFTVEGDSLVKTMWVEGISAHTAQQGTKLKMEYTISGTTCEDEAALTVVGVDQITWKGKSNNLNDNDTLDADPNCPGGLTSNALRVFPDARVVSGSVEANPRDKVTAEVVLTVEPPHQIKLYLESFDTDDPTADTSPVDDEANEEDNRGTSPAKAGQFTGESGGVLELVFPENVKTTNSEFQVTMQPGDNFRIVANGDKDFLSRLENKDSASGASNTDKHRICNKDVTGTLAEREVRQAADYASDTLVVWRFLHVEVDSMAAPPTTGAEKNTADGNLTGVVGNGTAAQRVNLNINLKTGFTPQDNSDNLTAGTGNGRFENGWIKIGSGGGTPGQTQTSALLGNGDDYVRKDAGIDIPAVVSKSGQSDVGGKVIAWSGSAFTLSVSSGTLSTNYNGGSLNVAGLSATITTVNTNGGANVVNVTAAPTIPFVLHDDDAASHPYQPNTSLMQASDSTNQNLFAAAYIRPVYDLGSGAQTNDFQRNVESTADALAQLSAGRDSASYPRFWTAYVQGTFQGMTRISFPGIVAGDSDPNAEMGVLGITPGLNSLGALIFVETIRDSEVISSIPSGSLLQKTTAHETGHEFGLDHENNSIMQQGYPVPLLFAPRHLNDMRSKSNP
jgi:hypothetical protein